MCVAVCMIVCVRACMCACKRISVCAHACMGFGSDEKDIALNLKCYSVFVYIIKQGVTVL